jgi:hypothetical protein
MIARGSSLVSLQGPSSNLAEFLSRRLAQNRKCLTFGSKPSVISEIAFDGGGAVTKWGFVDSVEVTVSTVCCDHYIPAEQGVRHAAAQVATRMSRRAKQ